MSEENIRILDFSVSIPITDKLLNAPLDVQDRFIVQYLNEVLNDALKKRPNLSDLPKKRFAIKNERKDK